MNLYKKLFGMFMGSLLHLSAGIIITNILIKYYNYPQQLFYYIIGIFFAILPDFDILKPFIISLKYKKLSADSSHKFNFMHYPFIMLPLLFIISLSFPLFWRMLIVLNLLSHYIIDTAQSGSFGVGIQWLAPFFSRNFFRLAKPYKIKLININQYVMNMEEWINKIVLNPKYPEVWVNLGLFVLAIFSFLL